QARPATSSASPPVIQPRRAGYVRPDPIKVGPNSAVGSGARSRNKATSAAIGIVGGLLGVGGGGGGDGPPLAQCRISDREMTLFTDPRTGVAMKIGAKRSGDTVVVFSQVDKSP